MRIVGSWLLCIGLGLTQSAVAAGNSPTECPLVDDRQIRIESAADVESTRAALRQYIWGQPALPTDARVTITPKVPSPIGCSSEVLDHVDALSIDMPPANGADVLGEAWHFVPKATAEVPRRHRLVIVHNGHMKGEPACGLAFADGESALGWLPSRPYAGLQMTINALLGDGYDVLAVSMPRYVEQQCDQNHGLLFTSAMAPAAGSGMRYFLDPTLRSLNFLLHQHSFVDVSMTGLSGGGWTTTIYAAVDPRIRLSVPVAGSIPLYLRNGAKPGAFPELLRGASTSAEPMAGCSDNTGDAEQTDPDMYTLAGYPELYLLGAYGEGREQVQILNRRDGCCFGEAQHYDTTAYDSDLRDYERAVRERLQALGNPASFSVRVDEQSSLHQISRDAAHGVLLALLDRAQERIGAASAGLFVRGANGHLQQRNSQGWIDTGLASSGIPAVVEGAQHGLDLVYRDGANRPHLAWRNAAGWISQPLIVSDGDTSLPRGRVIGDPVAVASAGGLEVFALGGRTDWAHGAALYRWRVDAQGQRLERVAQADHAIGRIAALATDAGSELTAWLRSAEVVSTDPAPIPDYATSCVERPTTLYAAQKSAAAPWSALQRQPLSPGLSSFAAASRYEGLTRLHYTNALGELWEASSPNGLAPWQETPLYTSLPALSGTPAASSRSGELQVHARTEDGKLAVFTREVGAPWQDELVDVQGGESLRDSPTAIPGGTAWTGIDGEVYTRFGERVFVNGFDGD